MAKQKLSEAQLLKIVEMNDDSKSQREIARELGVNQGTVARALSKFRKDSKGDRLPNDLVNVPIDMRRSGRGDTLILTPDKPLTLDQMYDLFKIDRKLWVPIYVTTNQWQGFYKIKTPGKTGHQKVALWQTKVTWKRIIGESMEQAITDFVRKEVRPLPKPRLQTPKKYHGAEGQMVSWGLWDTHLGLYAWHREVGESMDLGIAVNRITNSVDDMVEELRGYPIEKIVMPIGNDFLHYDSVRMKTAFGEHHLDTDTRFAKVYAAGLRCLAYMVERAVELCPQVEVVYVPGNHDPTSSYTLCVALSQRYFNDDRVTFDLGANPRKYRKFGGTLLGFDHGQQCKPNQLSLIFATEAKKDWTDSTYREIQIGHVHQRHEHLYQGVSPTNGVLIRTNPALCNVDVWHHNQGLIGEPVKSVEAWRYDRTGYRGSHVAWARDDANECLKNVPLTREKVRNK